MSCNEKCGNCIWHENFEGTMDWICTNEDSDCCGAVTSYNDHCTDYEPRYDK